MDTHQESSICFLNRVFINHPRPGRVIVDDMRFGQDFLTSMSYELKLNSLLTLITDVEVINVVRMSRVSIDCITIMFIQLLHRNSFC